MENIEQIELRKAIYKKPIGMVKNANLVFLDIQDEVLDGYNGAGFYYWINSKSSKKIGPFETKELAEKARLKCLKLTTFK